MMRPLGMCISAVMERENFNSELKENSKNEKRILNLENPDGERKI